MIRLVSGTRTAVLPPMWLARARVAKKVVQSPHEEAALAHHSLENGPLRKSSIYNPQRCCVKLPDDHIGPDRLPPPDRHCRPVEHARLDRLTPFRVIMT